ncbi:MAG: RIP metalloprotease RseP [Pseudomonadota bacterium]
MENPSFLFSVGAFLLLLGPLVFIHEMGHYLVGRWCGVKADVFSIGFGREIFGWNDKSGTRWKVSMIPLGGYVQFAGDMNPASQPDADLDGLSEAERNQTFQSKTLLQRAAIVFAGPAVNFLFAILIFAGFALIYGKVVTPPLVENVEPGTAAAEYQLEEGDRILAINGEEIAYFEDIRQHVMPWPGAGATLSIERDGTRLEKQVTLGTAYQEDRFGNKSPYGLLGIAPPKQIIEPVSLLEAPVYGIDKTVDVVKLMITTLGQIITGTRSVKELGGVLKIGQVSGEQLAAGPIAFISLIALISINLGFINLLPIPMLDGGHLLFYAIEAVRRRPLGPNATEWAYRFGLSFVLVFMVLVTVNDLLSFRLLG